MHESKGYLDARLEYLFGSISKTFLIENMGLASRMARCLVPMLPKPIRTTFILFE